MQGFFKGQTLVLKQVLSGTQPTQLCPFLYKLLGMKLILPIFTLIGVMYLASCPFYSLQFDFCISYYSLSTGFKLAFTLKLYIHSSL